MQNKKKSIKIPGSIWALGFVSLFMDASSELIHSLLPIFMVSTLGASVISVGIVEGIAEATSQIVKIFSGTLSDYLHKRKLLTMIGYGLAAFTKPLFPIAHSIEMVLFARFLDRIGKGIRGTPRDAMVGDIAPPEIRGACFGLRQSLDTVGAVIGPLLAVCGMFLLSGNIRAVLWIAVIPAFISFFVLAFGVKEPKVAHPHATVKLSLASIRDFNPAFWHLVIIGGIFTLAKFSEAFLILKAHEIGLKTSYLPFVFVVMNLIYALAAYPAGILSDRIHRKAVLLLGIIFLIMADVLLAFTGNLWSLSLSVSLWGMHMAFTQGIFASMITDVTEPHLRGTAFGLFNFVSGTAMLLSSLIAGILWQTFGSFYTFIAGALFATVTMMFLCLSHEK